MLTQRSHTRALQTDGGLTAWTDHRSSRLSSTSFSPATPPSSSWLLLKCSQARWDMCSLQRVLDLPGLSYQSENQETTKRTRVSCFNQLVLLTAAVDMWVYLHIDITVTWLLVIFDRLLDQSEFWSDGLQSLLLDRTAAVSLADDNSTHGSTQDVNFSLLNWEERKCIIVGCLQYLLLSLQQERLSGLLPLII